MIQSLSRLGLAAITVASLLAGAAHATNLVVNGSFNGPTAKGDFAGHVSGWSGGGGLTFIDTPGTADDGSYLSVYGPFAKTSPDGGNFVEADGDPTYSDAIYQTIANLTVGQTYTVSFYQAAGQQVGFTGPTTERWQVSFGDMTQLSSQYSLPEGGVGPWQSQTLSFVANATSQLLSFLAVGTPNGAPPISFLDGVSVQAAPEPASVALLVLGAAAMLGARASKRARD